MVNDETTKSGFNWMQTIAIRVNSSTKQVTYNPWFYAYKHFAHYVKPGAKAVKYAVNGSGPAKTNAFLNPNGDVVLVCSNTNGSTFALTVKVGNMMYKASLPPNSFNTLLIASGNTTVQKKDLEKDATPALNNVRICNSKLYFTSSAAPGAKEMHITLNDLQGRTVWTAHRKGSSIPGDQQAFAIQPAQGSLLPGAYLLTVQIKNSAGVITTFENKVKAVN
jgi:hypothetical protein